MDRSFDPTAQQAPEPHSSHKRSRSSAKTLRWVVLGVVLVLILVGVSLFATNSNKDNNTTGNNNSSSSSGKVWQSVFLTNGQVYFGHIKEIKSDVIELEDIYYLQVQQTLQPPQEGQQQQAQQLSLVKLGRSELHCPVDSMTINRDQVLFWEELKDESKVVQAINEYLKTDDVTKKCYEKQSQS